MIDSQMRTELLKAVATPKNISTLEAEKRVLYSVLTFVEKYGVFPMYVKVDHGKVMRKEFLRIIKENCADIEFCIGARELHKRNPAANRQEQVKHQLKAIMGRMDSRLKAMTK